MKTKQKKVSKKSRFSKFRPKSKGAFGWKFVVFTIAIATIGSFAIIRSFAASTTVGSVTNCGQKYCYYTIDAKVAGWVKNLRSQYTPYNQYLPLNDCVSGFARGWAVHISNLDHPMTDADHSGQGYNCGDWSAKGEIMWKGFCQNLAPAGNTALAEKNADDCAWKAVYGDPGGSFWDDKQPGQPHRAIMLDPKYNRIGVGAIQDFRTGTTSIVIDFVQLR